jgi:hypothetical protein
MMLTELRALHFSYIFSKKFESRQVIGSLTESKMDMG